jgi:hypothetical protein
MTYQNYQTSDYLGLEDQKHKLGRLAAMLVVQKNIKYLFLFFIFNNVSATEIDYSLGVIVSKIDNLNLAPGPTQGEISESISATTTIVENTANLMANINASMQAVSYRNNQASDENIGGLVANVLWTISPSRYEWFFADTYAQTLINSRESNTPNNRQNTNAFSTGPNLIFRINSRNNFNLEARAETISFEGATGVVDTDNERLEFTTSWDYQLQAGSTLSLNYVVEAVDFEDETANSNFGRNDLFFGLNYRRGVNTFDTQIGVTRVDNQGSADVSERRFRLSMLNARTRTSTVQLEVVRNLTDTSSELLSQLPGAEVVGAAETSTSDIFLDKTSRFIYNKTLMSGSLNLNIYRTTNEYQQQKDLNQTQKAALLTGLWNVQRASQLSFTAQYTNTVFNNDVALREDDDYLYTLLYTYSARRNVSVSLEATSQKRVSEDLTLTDRNYEDFRTVLSLTYTTQ